MAVYKTTKGYRFKCKTILGEMYYSKIYDTKKEARADEQEFIKKRDNPKNILFKVIADDYFKNLEKIRKKSTVYTYYKDYKKHLEPFFGDLPANNINVQLLNEWVLKIDKKGLKTSFKNKIYNNFKNIMNYAYKHYGIDNQILNVYGNFQEKKDTVVSDEEKIKYITYDEFQKFISVIPEDNMYYAVFNFLYLTGCRVGEMIALTFEDIDFENGIITINKTLYSNIKGGYSITSTKNNQNRTIKMSKQLLDIMLKYNQQIIKYDDYTPKWFVFGCGVHLSTTTLNRYKDMYIKESGCPHFTCHMLRHSHVSLLINEYVKSSREKNMKVDTSKFFLMMSNRMGHTVDVMQRTYLHMFPTMQDEIVDLLDNI